MKPVMRYFQSTLLSRRQLNRDNFLLYFSDLQVASEAQPGQFVMIAADLETDCPYPLLMRPFSVFGVEQRTGQFSVLVKTVGLGTRKMAGFPPGSPVPTIGLLGNQFVVREGRTVLMVAGGVGIAPFYLMAQQLVPRQIRPVLFYGARSREGLVTLEDFVKLGVEVHAVTEDGSYGSQGLVTAVVGDYLAQHDNCDLFACGPTPMLAAASDLAVRAGVPLQVSVECYMACGFGACFGCAVETKTGFRLACQHGPVFDGLQMIWERGHV